MQKQVSLTPEVEKQLTRLRKKHADENGKPSSYSRVIKRVMRKADLWESDKRAKKEFHSNKKKKNGKR